MFITDFDLQNLQGRVQFYKLLALDTERFVDLSFKM